jgi:Tfp pilus tip-associated adhesin PilY1
VSGRGERGSALVITMLLLVVLTALGLYMVGISASGIESASVGEADKGAMNAAEAGAYYAIDRLPLLASERGIALPNGAMYDVSATPSGTEAIPGFDSGWMRAVFHVRSTGRAPAGGRAARTIEAAAAFGPVPSGTGYRWDADADRGPTLPAPLGSLPVPVGPPSPFYVDPVDPASRNAFVQRHARRRRTLLAAGADGGLRAFDAGSWDPRASPPGYGPGTAREEWTYLPAFPPSGQNEPPVLPGRCEGYADGSPAVADIRVEAGAVSPGGGAKPGWRTYAIGGAGKGGRGYYALDITDPGSADYPEPVWELGKDAAPRLGATWSTPEIGRVRRPAGPGEPGARWVAVVGAGRARPAGATVLLRPADLRGRGGGPRSVAVESTAGAPESGRITLSRTALERRGGRWVSRTYRATATYSAKTGTAFENLVFRGRIDAVEYPGSTTLVSWSGPGDEGRAILVLDASTGRVVEELTHPDMGEVVASPTIVTDGEGYIERVYVGDLSGNVWRVTVDRAGTFDLGEGPFFTIAGEAYSRRIFSKAAVAGGEAPYPRLWVHFGTGDRESPLDGPGGAVFAVYDDLPAGSRAKAGAAALTERNLADATGFFTAIAEHSARFPQLGATAAGWYAALPGPGEKLLSPPGVFSGNLFFTSFLPGGGSCAAEGVGRIYGIGTVPGKNQGEGALWGELAATAEAATAPSRMRELSGGGIPSAPVVSPGTRGDAVLYVGSPEERVDAVRIPGPGSNKSIRYWRDAARDRRAPGH